MDKVKNSTGKLKPEHDPNNQRRNMQNGPRWGDRSNYANKKYVKCE